MSLKKVTLKSEFYISKLFLKLVTYMCKRLDHCNLDLLNLMNSQIVWQTVQKKACLDVSCNRPQITYFSTLNLVYP